MIGRQNILYQTKGDESPLIHNGGEMRSLQPSRLATNGGHYSCKTAGVMHKTDWNSKYELYTTYTYVYIRFCNRLVPAIDLAQKE